MNFNLVRTYLTASLKLENDTLSAVFAIGAVTFFWGIKELFEYKQTNYFLPVI